MLNEARAYYKKVSSNRSRVYINSDLKLDTVVKSSLDKKSICVWFNTHNRPHLVGRLLGDIARNGSEYNIKVKIFDDYSDSDCTEIVAQYSNELNIEYNKTAIRYGKREYWKLINSGLKSIADDDDFDYYIKMDDDFGLVDGFFTKCIQYWNSISDPHKICLHVFTDKRYPTDVR